MSANVQDFLPRPRPPAGPGYFAGYTGSPRDLERLSEHKQAGPVPLVRVLPPSTQYPTDALGAILAPAARAIAEIVQVPAALAGNSVLAAAGLAAQAHGDVQTLGGWRPISLYMLTIAESGERKTTADQVATHVVKERQKRLQVEFKQLVRDYEASAEAQKARVRDAKESAKGDPDALKDRLLAIDEAQPPRKPFMMVSEPTAEGLIISLKDGQLSQGLFNDEGGAFIGGHALSQDAELRTIAMLSRAWEGSPLDRVRAKDREHVTLYGRRLSLHLLCQPAVASRLLGRDLYRSQGFLARFLIAAPASLIGTRIHNGHSLDARNDARVVAYWNALNVLLDRRPDENQELGGLSPPGLPLSLEARALLVSAYNEIETAQRADGDLANVREFASKAAEHACRIAAVLSLVSNPGATEVDAEAMRNGLTLVQFYSNEQDRLLGSATVAPEIDNGQKLLDWMKRKALRSVTARDVMRTGPNSIRDAATAKTAIRLCEEYGWLVSENGRDYTMPPAAWQAMQEGSPCSD